MLSQRIQGAAEGGAHINACSEMMQGGMTSSCSNSGSKRSSACCGC
jgi:hypothetical protein